MLDLDEFTITKKFSTLVLNFEPQAGHEQAGRRIAIVLSPKDFNAKTGFIVVCPITNQKKGYPFEVELAHGISPRYWQPHNRVYYLIKLNHWLSS